MASSLPSPDLETHHTCTAAADLQPLPPASKQLHEILQMDICSPSLLSCGTSITGSQLHDYPTPGLNHSFPACFPEANSPGFFPAVDPPMEPETGLGSLQSRSHFTPFPKPRPHAATSSLDSITSTASKTLRGRLQTMHMGGAVPAQAESTTSKFPAYGTQAWSLDLSPCTVSDPAERPPALGRLGIPSTGHHDKLDHGTRDMFAELYGNRALGPSLMDSLEASRAIRVGWPAQSAASNLHPRSFEPSPAGSVVATSDHVQAANAAAHAAAGLTGDPAEQAFGRPLQTHNIAACKERLSSSRAAMNGTPDHDPQQLDLSSFSRQAASAPEQQVQARAFSCCG